MGFTKYRKQRLISSKPIKIDKPQLAIKLISFRDDIIQTLGKAAKTMQQTPMLSGVLETIRLCLNSIEADGCGTVVLFAWIQPLGLAAAQGINRQPNNGI